MLSSANIYATLPAADLDRAKRFYSEQLGLEPESESPGGNFYSVGGSRFLIFPTGGRPSGRHTQLGFQVSDIEAEVAALQSRGVVFEEYDEPRTVNGIATTGEVKAAWFQDSEGNLIGVVQLPE